MHVKKLLTFHRPFKSTHEKFAVLMMPAIVTALIVVNVRRLFYPSEKTTPWDVRTTTENKVFSKMATVGGFFDCDTDSMMPSTSVPEDVNKVRPADIKSIGALGDSIMAGYMSKNFDYESDRAFLGNSFITGADESLEQHVTIANILRKFNPNLKGISNSASLETSGFNVAYPGANSSQLPAQAETLVKMFKQEVDLSKSWKLIFVFIGTNDLGSPSCHNLAYESYVSQQSYKKNIEESTAILKNHLPKTIVALIPMWHPRLAVEAEYLIDKQNADCWDDREKLGLLEEVSRHYTDVAYEIQNEKKFDSNDFTVVAQGFMDNHTEPVREATGLYNKKFYASDLFHLSKYGNAVLALHLWNCLLEPVGKKNTKADLSNDATALQCPKKPYPYIRTLGNSLV